MVNQRAVSQYAQVSNEARVAAANPHRLVQMLMAGFLQRVAEARGALQRGQMGVKGEAVSKAIGIVGGLREALNRDAAPELTANLDELYAFMQRELVIANKDNDDAKLEQIAALMRTIKEGWDGIAQPAPEPETSGA